MAQLVGILVALIGVGIWAIVNSGTSAAHKRAQLSFVPPPQPPFCSTCGTPGYWNAQANMWGCDRCKQWIVPAAAATPPPIQPGVLPMQAPVFGGLPTSAPSTFCPTCGSPGRWMPEVNAYGCDRCRTTIAR